MSFMPLAIASPGIEEATPAAPALTRPWASLSWPSGEPPGDSCTLRVTPRSAAAALAPSTICSTNGIALSVGDKADRDVVRLGGQRRQAERDAAAPTANRIASTQFQHSFLPLLNVPKSDATRLELGRSTSRRSLFCDDNVSIERLSTRVAGRIASCNSIRPRARSAPTGRFTGATRLVSKRDEIVSTFANGNRPLS